MSTITEIRKKLQEINIDVVSLEKFFKDTKQLNLPLVKYPEANADFSYIKSNIQELHQQILTANLVKQRDVQLTNGVFEKNTLELKVKVDEYDNQKSDENASSVFKLDIYDRNIEDNLYILYYFFSYGILGLFIYKIIKQ